jgi:hypothetical protein
MSLIPNLSQKDLKISEAIFDLNAIKQAVLSAKEERNSELLVLKKHLEKVADEVVNTQLTQEEAELLVAKEREAFRLAAISTVDTFDTKLASLIAKLEAKLLVEKERDAFPTSDASDTKLSSHGRGFPTLLPKTEAQLLLDTNERDVFRQGDEAYKLRRDTT